MYIYEYSKGIYLSYQAKSDCCQIRFGIDLYIYIFVYSMYLLNFSNGF